MSLPPLPVGSAVEVFVGTSDQSHNPALFYQWRKCQVREVDQGRVLVRFDKNVDREDEWVDVHSDRLRLPGGARPLVPIATSHVPPPLLTAPQSPLPPSVAPAHIPTASIIPFVEVNEAVDESMEEFYDTVDAIPRTHSATSSHVASPSSAEAARLIAAQGVDATFFSRPQSPLPPPVPVPSSGPPVGHRTARPPPLPANIPPRLTSARGSGVTSPTTSPTLHPTTIHFHSSPSDPPPHSLMSDVPPHGPPPLPTSILPPQKRPSAPNGGSASGLPPLTFDQYVDAHHRSDPPHSQQQGASHHHGGGTAGGAAPHLVNGRPSLTSLPVTTHPPQSHSLPPPHSLTSSVSAIRKTSADYTASPPPPLPVEVLTEFARQLAPGDLVDVWKPTSRQWLLGEVVDVSHSAEKGSMINVIDHASNTREWIRRASRRIVAPFTNSDTRAGSPPPSPVRQPPPQKKPAPPPAPESGGMQQKVSAALSSLSSAASAAASSAAAVLLPSPSVHFTSNNGPITSPKAAQQKVANAVFSHPPPTSSPPPPPPVHSMGYHSVTLPPSSSTSSSSSSSLSSSAAVSGTIPIPLQSIAPPPPPPQQGSAVLPEASVGFGPSLVVGSLLDAFDTDDKWRLAEVLHCSDRQVYIHYQGWSAKWDEWVDRESRRLQPPRLFSVGDTGAKSVAPQPIAQPIAPSYSSPSSYSAYSYTPPPPAYTVSLSAKPSSRYDCRNECKWKRVLSMGLGHREMQALDGLFSRCCELQDQYQERILVSEESNPQLFKSFREALASLSAEIEKVKKALPAFASFYTTQCANIVKTIDSGISESEEAVKRQLLALQEAAYMQKLRSRFQLVEVPADGSCLFTAVGKGMLWHSEQTQHEEEQTSRQPPPLPTAQDTPPQPTSPPPPPPAQTPPETPSALPQSPPVPDSSDTVMSEDESSAGKEEALPSVASAVETPMEDAAPAPVVVTEPPPLPSSPPPTVLSPVPLPRVYRSQCVHHLLSNAAFHPAIRREVREAVIQEREGHGDPTSALILQLLHQHYQTPEAIETALNSTDDDTILQVYAAAMEKEGIYGTQLEVEALSSALHVPIHIYYRAGSEHDGEGGGDGLQGDGELKPTQIVGEQEKGGPPISLAYYMGNRHYNLLVPRPPPPPPPPQPIAPPALPTSTPVLNQRKSAEMLDSVGSHPPDDELMVALLEGGTPSPLPPVKGGDGMLGNGLDVVGLKRSRSGVPLSTDRTSDNSEVVDGTGGRLHRHGGSKDELHLLLPHSGASKSPVAPSHSKVRSIVSSWEAGAPSALLKLNPQQQPTVSSTTQEDRQSEPLPPSNAGAAASFDSHHSDSTSASPSTGVSSSSSATTASSSSSSRRSSKPGFSAREDAFSDLSLSSPSPPVQSLTAEQAQPDLPQRDIPTSTSGAALQSSRVESRSSPLVEVSSSEPRDPLGAEDKVGGVKAESVSSSVAADGVQVQDVVHALVERVVEGSHGKVEEDTRMTDVVST